MENEVLTRSYLETLSFLDLVNLADNYGIDVPENLNRNFLIAELLEVSQEEDLNDDVSMMISDQDDEEIIEKKEDLPMFYNTTEVQMLLRNPAWAFVYWNISEADINTLSNGFDTSLILRVCTLKDKEEQTPEDTFNIQISMNDKEQYILLPAGKRFFRVDLLCNIDGFIDILASSAVLEIPEGTEKLANIHPGNQNNISKILELSGMNELIMNQYKNHRESFS